mmetsp:Transcript_39099/g.123289  ORF Transcript_39099/g.123289 Transcript_39099/m.123289 type:complete len:119 (-) Transcript_39099:254-610(-)
MTLEFMPHRFTSVHSGTIQGGDLKFVRLNLLCVDREEAYKQVEARLQPKETRGKRRRAKMRKGQRPKRRSEQAIPTQHSRWQKNNRNKTKESEKHIIRCYYKIVNISKTMSLQEFNTA